MDVPQGLRLGLHPVPGRFSHKARTAQSRVPVVVGEMVEGTLGDCWTSLARDFESNRKIETLSCHFTFSSCDHSSRFIVRSVDGALVRVCWQEPDCASGRVRVRQYRMYGCDDRDFLKVAVCARVKIRPGDVG